MNNLQLLADSIKGADDVIFIANAETLNAYNESSPGTKHEIIGSFKNTLQTETISTSVVIDGKTIHFIDQAYIKDDEFVGTIKNDNTGRTEPIRINMVNPPVKELEAVIKFYELAEAEHNVSMDVTIPALKRVLKDLQAYNTELSQLTNLAQKISNQREAVKKQNKIRGVKKNCYEKE